jgi:hypothetical protein
MFWKFEQDQASVVAAASFARREGLVSVAIRQLQLRILLATANFKTGPHTSKLDACLVCNKLGVSVAKRHYPQ